MVEVVGVVGELSSCGAASISVSPALGAVLEGGLKARTNDFFFLSWVGIVFRVSNVNRKELVFWFTAVRKCIQKLTETVEVDVQRPRVRGNYIVTETLNVYIYQSVVVVGGCC